KSFCKRPERLRRMTGPSIGFSLLAALLRKHRDASEQPLFDVTTRDRDPLEAPDSLLSKLDRSDYHQLWLFAVDVDHFADYNWDPRVGAPSFVDEPPRGR